MSIVIGVLVALLASAPGIGWAVVHAASQSVADGPPAWQTTAGRWVTRDHQSFDYTVWQAAAPPRAVVIAIHGLSGAARDFRPLGQAIAAQGVTTYAYELRGQGYDPVVQRRGDLTDWRLWLDDLSDFSALVRQNHPNLPLLYYGESMGALIALHAAARPAARGALSGLILASPVVQLKRTLPWWQVGLLRIFTALLPTYRLAFSRADRPLPKLTRDTAYQAWLQQAPQTLSGFTLRLLRQIEILMRRSHAAATRLHLPVLVLYAGRDAFTTPQMVERFFGVTASRDKEKHLFPESYHLLLHDADRAQVIGVIERWLAQRHLSAH